MMWLEEYLIEISVSKKEKTQRWKIEGYGKYTEIDSRTSGEWINDIPMNSCFII